MGKKKFQKNSHRKKRNNSKQQNKDQIHETVLHHSKDVKDTTCQFDGVLFPEQLNISKQVSCNGHKHMCNNTTSQLISLSKTRFTCKNSVKTKSMSTHGLELAVYDPTFAQDQIVQHSGTCVVCKKTQYFMKTCSRCHMMKYCSRECLHKHCKNDAQKVICVRSILFISAMKYIPQEMKHIISSVGWTISSHLYTIPRREIYLMMGGTRSVVLLQVFNVSFNQPTRAFQILVQDVDGFITVLQFNPSEKLENFLLLDSFQKLQATLPVKSFLLLFNAHWNVHADKASAAVDISKLQQILPIQHTDEILQSVTHKDQECLAREWKKFGSQWESNEAIQHRI